MAAQHQLPDPPEQDAPQFPIVQVAVAAPLPDLFDYLSPANGEDCAIGQRVLVPFGRGRRVGLVAGRRRDSALPASKLKPIERCIDAVPLLSPRDIELILWAAGYYFCAPGEAIFSALPARLRRPLPMLDERRKVWRAAPGNTSEQAESGLHRAPRQQTLLAALQAHPDGLDQSRLREQFGSGVRAPLKALAEKGLAECIDQPPALELDPATGIDMAAPVLNAEQSEAVAAVDSAAGFGCFLLDGVTGSGKTEVYIRLITNALSRGRQVLVLVPEIGLTPQLARRFSRRIPAPQAVLHSGLGERERELAWQRAARGVARVVLGTRSAVFTPLPDLGLIVVDEEHDLSLKQQDGFRYSARDLAVRRAQLHNCPILLGSATPSLETLHNAVTGRYRHLHLRQRAGKAQAPRFLLADVRSQPLIVGLSHALLTRMSEVIEAGNQVLLFLNRRGFSPVLTCHDCGWISVCHHCDARMTLHRGRGRLICHHCGDQTGLPVQCPYCESPDLRPLGQGTERIEDSLRQRFPGIPLARIDRDSTRRKGELERVLAAARDGTYPILIGTQMLAKGHHLPGVTLVGILDLDYGLYGSDFRASERMAQLLTQVAGRAGRANLPGTVLVQTRHPQHPLLQRLLRQGYGAFAEAALAERAEAALPPFSFQALVRAESRQEALALDFLHAARAQAQALGIDAVEVWGPAPATMERRAGRFRAQLLLQCRARAPLHTMIAAITPDLRGLATARRLRWSVDIDPQETS
jgi:primosomal protein N' (replication factor Y)